LGIVTSRSILPGISTSTHQITVQPNSLIWSMILRLIFETFSMEKKGNQFTAGTIFSQRDAFRES